MMELFTVADYLMMADVKLCYGEMDNCVTRYTKVEIMLMSHLL